MVRRAGSLHRGMRRSGSEAAVVARSGGSVWRHVGSLLRRLMPRQNPPSAWPRPPCLDLVWRVGLLSPVARSSAFGAAPNGKNNNGGRRTPWGIKFSQTLHQDSQGNEVEATMGA